MAEVICTGVAFLDHVFELDAAVGADGKTFARGFSRHGGGMAATAAVAVARLGGFAQFWGRLGDDGTGDMILAELSAYAVTTEFVRRVPGAKSPVSTVLLGPGGERQVVAFPGEALDSDAGWLPLGRIADTSAVLADPRWPEGAAACLERARANGLPAVLDAEVGPEPVPRDLVGLASHVVFSRAGLAQYAGTEDLAEGLARAAADAGGLVAATAGAEGFYWREADGRIRHLPAHPVHAVDTLGAGDVFHGAFALALGEEKDIETAARFATVAAGLKCARTGGRAAIPDRAEVWAVLNGGGAPEAAAG